MGDAVLGAALAVEGTTAFLAGCGVNLLQVGCVISDDQGRGEEERVGEESAEIHVVRLCSIKKGERRSDAVVWRRGW